MAREKNDSQLVGGLFQYENEYGEYWMGNAIGDIPEGAGMTLVEVTKEKREEMQRAGKRVPTFWLRWFPPRDEGDRKPQPKQQEAPAKEEAPAQEETTTPRRSFGRSGGDNNGPAPRRRRFGG